MTFKKLEFRHAGTLLAVMMAILLTPSCQTGTTSKTKSWAYISKNATREDIISKAAHIVPSERQMAWQKDEFIAFIHFNLFTFLDPGVTPGPDIFNPTDFDADQWVATCKNTGMKKVILTAKHHRGFCLWPSKYTEYSVKSSPWKNGNGDIVKEVADACQKYGLEFGIYISPWDMHEPTYGTPAYDTYFENQLRELLTNYGHITEVWFDGHYAGPEGKKQHYKWTEYYSLIRRLQPDAVIAMTAPDIRWVGNEDGYATETEWSVAPVAAPENMNSEPEGNFNPDQLFPQTTFNPKKNDNPGGVDFLSNLKRPFFLTWYPAETDVSIRPSWGFRPGEHPRSLEELLDIYYKSVGMNTVLLLNFAPDRRGLIPDEDVQRAGEFRKVLDVTFRDNLAVNAKVKASDTREGFNGDDISDGNMDTYWITPKGMNKATLEFELGDEKTFNRVALQEHILSGQRISSFTLEAWDGTEWKECARGTTVGYKRLLRCNDVTTSKVRLTINDSRESPTLNNLGLYYQPPVEDILKNRIQNNAR